jgi:hypothetical protein
MPDAAGALVVPRWPVDAQRFHVRAHRLHLPIESLRDVPAAVAADGERRSFDLAGHVERRVSNIGQRRASGHQIRWLCHGEGA